MPPLVHIATIHQVRPRQQIFTLERGMNVWEAFIISGRGGRGLHMCDEVGTIFIARFGQMHAIPTHCVLRLAAQWASGS